MYLKFKNVVLTQSHNYVITLRPGGFKELRIFLIVFPLNCRNGLSYSDIDYGFSSGRHQ